MTINTFDLLIINVIEDFHKLIYENHKIKYLLYFIILYHILKNLWNFLIICTDCVNTN